MPSHSFWLDGRGQNYEPLQGDERADVVIVGAGIAGLTAAYLLSAAGVCVTVLEARTVGSGASGHTGGYLTAHHGLDYRRLAKRYGWERAGLIARANEGAVHLAAGIIDSEEISCGFALLDSYVFTEDAARKSEIEAEAEAASKLGFTVDMASAEPFLFAYAAAVRLRRQAALQPVDYLEGLARGVARNAGRIHEWSRVLRISDNAVLTAEGRVRTRCTVVATDFPIAGIPGHYPLRMQHRRTCAAVLEGVAPPQGLWISCDKGGYAYRGQDGRLVVCRGGHAARAEDDAACHEALRKDMLGKFPETMPAGLWSAQYADTVDGLPYIGKCADRTGCRFVAAGFGRWGLTEATLAGHIVSDMILDRENSCAAIYAPQRHLTSLGWGHAAAANVAAAWQLAASAFRPKGPVCSHAGCRLVWNAEEESWDCPCHGSRFSADGNVLDAPAVKAIKPQRGP